MSTSPVDEPAPTAVDEVVASCDDCSRPYARMILMRNGNDVEKTIAFDRSMSPSLREVARRRFLQAPLHEEDSVTAPRHSPAPEHWESLESSQENDSMVEDGGEDQDNDDNDAYKEWDFVLPRVPAPLPFLNGGATGLEPFNLTDLVGAIQSGTETTERIQSYLAFYFQPTVGPDGQQSLTEAARHVNGKVAGVPAFFYVVETRDAQLVRLWASYGGDVNTTHPSSRTPLLGYAIALGVSFASDTRLIVASLLSLGASVEKILRNLYTPLERDLPDAGFPSTGVDGKEKGENNSEWATALVHARLARALNFCFTTRYYLHLASLLPNLSGAKRWLAKDTNASALLGIHYFLIGQTMASTFLINRMLVHLARPTKRPVVLVFAGPSGHGKTELAQNLGTLLSLPFRAIDCTTVRQETDLFGPRAPYVGHEAGSPLNNFLAENNGNRCVVFLDEFEKTGQDIRQTLLIPFQNGAYQDRRTLRDIDCSKTIWIMATNAFDATIHEFCRRNEAVLFDPEAMPQAEKLGADLAKDLKRESVGKFGAPLTGRINTFVPFLTFSPVEQAVVADKYVAEFGQDIMAPVKIVCDEPRKHRVGDVDLRVRQGYSMCTALASSGYDPELGARSVINEVEDQIHSPVILSYLEMERVVEDQGRSAATVGVNRDHEIEVTFSLPVKETGDEEMQVGEDSEDDQSEGSIDSMIPNGYFSRSG